MTALHDRYHTLHCPFLRRGVFFFLFFPSFSVSPAHRLTSLLQLYSVLPICQPTSTAYTRQHANQVSNITPSARKTFVTQFEYPFGATGLGPQHCRSSPSISRRSWKFNKSPGVGNFREARANTAGLGADPAFDTRRVYHSSDRF